MSNAPDDDYILVFPDGDEARFRHDLLPGQQEHETLIEVDPLIQEFLRAPYDPVIGAAAMGRLTGEVVRNPPRGGWVQLLTVFVAAACIGSSAWALVWLYGAKPEFELGPFRFQMFMTLIVSTPFALAGLLILWRLARR